jgi:seryl-tRNA synthetase
MAKTNGFFDQFADAPAKEGDGLGKKVAKLKKTGDENWKKQMKQNKKGNKSQEKIRNEIQALSRQVTQNSQEIKEVKAFLQAVCQPPQPPQTYIIHRDPPLLPKGDCDGK